MGKNNEDKQKCGEENVDAVELQKLRFEQRKEQEEERDRQGGEEQEYSDDEGEQEETDE